MSETKTMDATCKTCPFWKRKDIAVDGVPDPGHCHHTHSAHEEDPQRRGDWWCSEHPLRQRDRLAAMAMQGLLAFVADSTIPDVPPSRLAANAYRIADAMLAARGEQP